MADATPLVVMFIVVVLAIGVITLSVNNMGYGSPANATNAAAADGSFLCRFFHICKTTSTTSITTSISTISTTKPTSTTSQSTTIATTTSSAATTSSTSTVLTTTIVSNYTVSALIGSVLNKAVYYGVPSATKSLASSLPYGTPDFSNINNTALDSPYISAGYVPLSYAVIASSNGGGTSWSTLTSAHYDNLLQVNSSQDAALLYNSGQYKETEFLWLTGFPVYDQQAGVQTFTVLNMGGAYEALFFAPIHEPYSGNSINNAVIRLLGQNWTIINYTLPAGTTSSSSFAAHGGRLIIRSGPSTLTLFDGASFNQTTNPGWAAQLLWINGSGNGHYTDLAGIIAYNMTPVSLLPGQSFSFIQSPKSYRVTFLGDTLGSNSDTVSVSSQSASNVNYANSPGSTGNGVGNINNITEPAQEVTVASQIPNAFTDGGFAGSSATYLLTPYTLTEVGTSTSVAGINSAQANVILSSTIPLNFVSSTNPLLVTISGYQFSTSSTPITTQLTFSSASSSLLTPMGFYNVTQIRLSRALPGIRIDAAIGGNDVAKLTTTNSTQIIYNVPGKIYYNTVSGSSLTYNQQNGQAASLFGMAQFSPVSIGNGQFAYFAYTMRENNVPSNSISQDAYSFDIVNSTAGVGASPLFQLNVSATGAPGFMSYQGSAGTVVNAQAGFVSEKGSKVASIGSTSLTFNLAKVVDTLRLSIH